MTEPTIEQMRSQRDELERKLAAASVDAAAAYVELLTSPDMDATMAAVTSAVETLDEPTRQRVASWVKMRSDLITIAKFDLARLRGLVAAEVGNA